MSFDPTFDPSTGETFDGRTGEVITEKKPARPRSQEVDIADVVPIQIIEMVLFHPRSIEIFRNEADILNALVAEAKIAGEAFYTSEESLGGPNLNVRAARAIQRHWKNSVVSVTQCVEEGEFFKLSGYYADFETRYLSAETFLIPQKWHYAIRGSKKLKAGEYNPSLQELNLMSKNSAQTGLGMLWRNLRMHNTPEHIRAAMLSAAQDALMKKLEAGIAKSGGWEQFVAGWTGAMLELGIKRNWIFKRFAITDIKAISREAMAALVHEYQQIKSGAFGVSDFWASFEAGGSNAPEDGRLDGMAAMLKAQAETRTAAPATETAPATAPAGEAAPANAPRETGEQLFENESLFERDETLELLRAARAQAVEINLESVMRIELTIRADPVNYGKLSLLDMKTLLQGFTAMIEKSKAPATATAPEDFVPTPLPAPKKLDARAAKLVARLLELRKAAEFEDSGRVAEAEKQLRITVGEYHKLTEEQMKAFAATLKEIGTPKAATPPPAAKREQNKAELVRDIRLFVGAAGEAQDKTLQTKIKGVFAQFQGLKFKELEKAELETIFRLKAALRELVEPFDAAGVPQ